MTGYQKIRDYWDKVFEKIDEFDPSAEIPQERIETALKWLCADCDRIIDFGCGTGKVLARCLRYGSKEVWGIDLSDRAVLLAQQVMKKYNLDSKCNFVCGDYTYLKSFKDNFFSGAVLFNIVDNLLPEDGKKLLKEVHRVLKPNGRVMLKLNPYLNPDDLADNSYRLISEDFYQGESGLYLWNISNELLKELIRPYFLIDDYEEINYEGYGLINRMFYLKVTSKEVV